MGCNCKSTNKPIPNTENGFNLGGSLVVRIITFLLGVIVLPLIFPIAIFMMFNQIVLKKPTDVSKMATSFTKFANRKKDKNNEDDIEEEDINPEEYEMTDVEVIK